MSIPNSCNCHNCQLKPLFYQKINEDEFQFLCDSRSETYYPKGSLICVEGEQIKEFMYLKTGLVKLHKRENEHRDQIIKIAKPLDFVNLLSIFSGDYYKYSVTALEDSTVCYMNLSVIKSLIMKNGAFALDILEKMNRITDDIIQTTFDISKKNLRGRIAYVLLYFSQSIYRNNSFELPLSHKKIAEFIEMTTENVIRIMSEFRKDGILKINGKIIEIADENRLIGIMEHG